MTTRTLHIEAWEYEKTDGTFTVAELHKQFDLVRDPDDWKAPVDIIVPDREIEITVAAIIWYTGVVPTSVSTEAPVGCSGNFWHVTSVGYRNGPCGP